MADFIDSGQPGLTSLTLEDPGKYPSWHHDLKSYETIAQ